MDLKFIAAMSTYAALGLLAGFTLTGRIRIATWLILGLFAIKTWLVVLKRGES